MALSKTFHCVTLGCPKNVVDSERMLGIAQKHGFEPAPVPDDADVILVNTCGFILKAKEESIDKVLELAAFKARRLKTLIMAGCLTERYGKELATELPEVDHFVGAGDFEALDRVLSQLETISPARSDPIKHREKQPDDHFNRLLLGSPHVAYLKIAEGCDRKCAFCVIPQIRGPQRSRSLDSLETEAKQLADAGVVELIIVAQDITAYGHDLAPRHDIVQVLERLAGLDRFRWIRLLYTYPSEITERLVLAMRDLPSVVPYIDIPFQHIDDGVLKAMRRGYTGDTVRSLVERLRKLIPHIFLRGTVLVGHPGESNQAHANLIDFLRNTEWDHLGAFAYSQEENTLAATLPLDVSQKMAKNRAAEVMKTQRAISRRKLKRLRGELLDILVDGPSEESEYLLEGRHIGQAPEIDGLVILTNCSARPGSFVQARVTDSGDYDLIASHEDTTLK